MEEKALSILADVTERVRYYARRNIADWLKLGEEARINRPGTSIGNWTWRVRPDACSADLARQIRMICGQSGRI